MAKNSSIKLFYFSSSLAMVSMIGTFHFCQQPAQVRWLVLLLGSCCYRSFVDFLSCGGNESKLLFLGIVLSFDLKTFLTYLLVHWIMYVLVHSMLLSLFLTSSFVIFCFCTWSRFFPRILHIAKWWKEKSFFRFFSVTFHDSQPQRRVLRGPARYTSFFTLPSTSLVLRKCLSLAFTLLIGVFIDVFV